MVVVAVTSGFPRQLWYEHRLSCGLRIFGQAFFPEYVPVITVHAITLLQALAPNAVWRILQSPFPRHSLFIAPKHLPCPSTGALAHIPQGGQAL